MMCLCHTQDVGLQDISVLVSQVLSKRGGFLLPWNVCPPLRNVKLLVKLVPTSNSRGGEGDLVGSSLFVALSSVLVLH